MPAIAGHFDLRRASIFTELTAILFAFRWHAQARNMGTLLNCVLHRTSFIATLGCHGQTNGLVEKSLLESENAIKCTKENDAKWSVSSAGVIFP